MKKLKGTDLYLIKERNDPGDIYKKLFHSTLNKYDLNYEDLHDEGICKEINKEIPYDR